jgi:hypothetical protein
MEPARILDFNAAYTRKHGEPWLSKAEIAQHLGFSTRWVELRVRKGMPHMRMGGRLRFQVSACEAWLDASKGAA